MAPEVEFLRSNHERRFAELMEFWQRPVKPKVWRESPK